jgi:dTDP-4-dehydrorhamnose reductase
MDGNSIFIIGANGQLGSALKNKYPKAQFADIDELDITNPGSVKNFDWSNINTVINAAAFTNVDGAESTEGRIASWKVNATAVSYIVETASKNNMTLVHISTDYVFDGTKNPHTENEAFSPLSVYGQSKAAGDILVSLAPKHYILRTSWVIGEGKNFVRTMLEIGKNGINPNVVSDQIGRLTFTSQLVSAIDHLLSSDSKFGTYNISNSGDAVSWAEITRVIFDYANYPLIVTDIDTADYYKGKEGIALRPLQSTLDLTKIQNIGFKVKDWRDDLRDYVYKEQQ